MRVRRRAQNIRIERCDGGRLPVQAILVKARFCRMVRQAVTKNGAGAAIQKPGPDQLTDHKADTAGSMEVIHIRLAVWIDARQQRRDL